MAKRLLIDDLLQKPKSVPLNDKITLWVRPLRDPEKTMAVAKGRNASRNLRKMLKNRKSDEYKEFIAAEVDNAEENDLRRVWVQGKLIERALKIRRMALEEREYIPNPLDADEGAEGVTPRDMDEYENAVDESEAERDEAVMKAISTAQKELTEEAEKIPAKDLKESAIPQLIESVCSNAYEAEFAAQMILRGTFEDEKCRQPAFSDVEQVYQLRPGPRDILVKAHTDLLLDQEAVKN